MKTGTAVGRTAPPTKRCGTPTKPSEIWDNRKERQQDCWAPEDQIGKGVQTIQTTERQSFGHKNQLIISQFVLISIPEKSAHKFRRFVLFWCSYFWTLFGCFCPPPDRCSKSLYALIWCHIYILIIFSLLNQSVKVFH